MWDTQVHSRPPSLPGEREARLCCPMGWLLRPWKLGTFLECVTLVIGKGAAHTVSRKRLPRSPTPPPQMQLPSEPGP